MKMGGAIVNAQEIDIKLSCCRVEYILECLVCTIIFVSGPR